MSHLTYLEAMVVGLVQGVTELFPVSSLGHNVLIPALIGGSWARDLDVSRPESPYLAFIVGLHVATAIAMIAYFWRDWLRIIQGLGSSIASLKVQTPEQRLAWMIILATIPVGIAGLGLEHLFRVAFSRPVPTSLFLAANGLILIGGERLRRSRGSSATDDPVPPAASSGHASARQAAAPGNAAVSSAAVDPATGSEFITGAISPGALAPMPGGTAMAPAMATGPASTDVVGTEPGKRATARPAPGSHARQQDQVLAQEKAIAADRQIAAMRYRRAMLIGSAQILALLPGISRDGVAMVAGMLSGLQRSDAARFSFLLSAPVILAAGALKVPDLMGPLGNGIRGQVLAGSLLSGIGAFLSLRFLMRYFSEARSLVPFGIYCLVAGLGSLAYLTLR